MREGSGRRGDFLLHNEGKSAYHNENDNVKDLSKIGPVYVRIVKHITPNIVVVSWVSARCKCQERTETGCRHIAHVQQSTGTTVQAL